DGVAPAEAAARVRASALREELVDALDFWAELPPGGPAGQGGLRQAAGLADSDDWRRGLRRALDARDWGAVRRLADEAPRDSLSPAGARMLSVAWMSVGEKDRALEVLREA